MADLNEANRYWRNPRFSTEPFWDSGVRVKVRDVDARFRKKATSIFMGLDHKKQTFEMERYHTVDLGKFLEAQDPEPAGGEEAHQRKSHVAETNHPDDSLA